MPDDHAPDLTGAAWTQAMRRGDFAAAWTIADAVLAARDLSERDDPALPYHLRWVWDGTPPDKRDVLVRCYHGLGDTLQFARFLPALRARSARVTLEIQPELAGLLAGRADRVVAFDPAHPLAPSSCDVEIMELGHALRVSADDVAASVPFLTAQSDARAADAIGLCWAAGGWDPARSVPLAPLLAACAGRPLISLQRGPAAAAASDPGFRNPGDCSTDMAATAALITGVACVVTVDTMVAHLAGALGRPTVLLAKADPDWRWPARSTRSLWYPSMTVLRQNAAGDWSGPLRRVEEWLSARRGR